MSYDQTCEKCGGAWDSTKHQMTCVAPKVGVCTIREHAGLEKIIQKINLCQELLPDPELGQDVAFLAFVMKKYKEALEVAEARLVNMRAAFTASSTETELRYRAALEEIAREPGVDHRHIADKALGNYA